MEAWNRLDFLVVFAAWAGRLTSGVANGAELARVFRTARIFLILQKNEGLTTIFSCLLSIIPAAFYIVVLNLLLVFVYAILGMQLFGDEPIDTDPNGGTRAAYGPDNNFGDVFSSMSLLFQITVGQSMTHVSHDLRHYGVRTVFLFFGSYFFLSSYVMLNLFVGVVVDAFDLMHTPRGEANSADEFPPSDMWIFREKWREHCLAGMEEKGTVLSPALTAQASRNPALLELPYNRVHRLLQELGGIKATQDGGQGGKVLHIQAENSDWMYYSLLQAELYAYKIQAAARVPGLTLAKSLAAHKRKPGVHEEVMGRFGPRGVGFHTLLCRLCLRRISKSTLMYDQQMVEKDTEDAFVSQNIIAAMLGARILLKFGPAYCPSTVDGQNVVHDTSISVVDSNGELVNRDPSAVWSRVSRGTFEAAVRGVRDLRISRLARLRRLVVHEHQGLTRGKSINPDSGSPVWSTNLAISPTALAAAQAKADMAAAGGVVSPRSASRIMSNPMHISDSDEEENQYIHNDTSR